MDDNVEQLLKNLKLKRVLEVLERETARAVNEQCGYTEFLSRLLREQYYYQQEQSLAYRIQLAKIPQKWPLSTFPFGRQPGVNPAAVRQLAELDFIPRAENVVFIGPAGTGKTGLATGLLLAALENGYRGLFVKAQAMFDEMYASMADRSSRSLVNRLSHYDVLVVDEMGYLNLRPEQSNIFFKLMDERYGRKPTLITTNLEYSEWYEFLGNKSMVGALLDRLRHRCHTVKIDGPSLRAPEIP